MAVGLFIALRQSPRPTLIQHDSHCVPSTTWRATYIFPAARENSSVVPCWTTLGVNILKNGVMFGRASVPSLMWSMLPPIRLRVFTWEWKISAGGSSCLPGVQLSAAIIIKQLTLHRTTQHNLICVFAFLYSRISYQSFIRFFYNFIVSTILPPHKFSLE